LLEKICQAAENKKAQNIKVLDIRKKSSLVDYLVVLSSTSTTHSNAVKKGVEEVLKKNQVKGVLWEGTPISGWIVLDLGFIALHIMSPAMRKYYNLEELWEKDAIIYHR